MDEPVTWSVIARNLPEHAGNAIHTDAGARAAGFPAALVAGVTTYAYLTHPCVAAWGLEWLAGGGGEVRFRAPVLAGDRVDCVPTCGTDGVRVDAVCPAHERNPRATFEAVRHSSPPPARREGETLPAGEVTLGEHYGADYGLRAGDDLDLYVKAGVVHPAVWPAIANEIFASQLVRGPWIHTRSLIRHHALGRVGTTVDVHAIVVRRFERGGGRRAVADIVIAEHGRPLVSIEHEAIVELSAD